MNIPPIGKVNGAQKLQQGGATGLDAALKLNKRGHHKHHSIQKDDSVQISSEAIQALKSSQSNQTGKAK